MYLKKTSDWVKELIQDVLKHIGMEMNFYMAQGFCRVGCFRSYLHKLGRAERLKLQFVFTTLPDDSPFPFTTR